METWPSPAIATCPSRLTHRMVVPCHPVGPAAAFMMFCIAGLDGPRGSPGQVAGPATLFRVDLLDADRDTWRLQPDLPARLHRRLDRARVIAAMMNDLLSVGPHDQVMADRRQPEVFAQLPRPVRCARARRKHLDDHQGIGN